MFGLFFFIFLKEGWASNQQIAIIRDAEIKMLVRDYAEPVRIWGGVMPDNTTRFSCNGSKIFHYMGCSTFSNFTVLPEIAIIAVFSFGGIDLNPSKISVWRQNLAIVCPDTSPRGDDVLDETLAIR